MGRAGGGDAKILVPANLYTYILILAVAKINAPKTRNFRADNNRGGERTARKNVTYGANHLCTSALEWVCFRGTLQVAVGNLGAIAEAQTTEFFASSSARSTVALFAFDPHGQRPQNRAPYDSGSGLRLATALAGTR